MMRKSWTKWILTAVIALVLIAGVPIIINERYKTNSGYMTIWGAADALAYYGAIIASIGAALGVFVSIKAATKNYRDDVRARVMPFIAVTPFERKATVNTMALLREKVEKSELKKLIAESDKQYDDIHDIIVAFRQLMPYARMMISYDGYLIPMDDQYFRIDPQNLGFKYGGEITCVGMITNIIGADTNPNDPKNMFATLQFTVNEALRKILPTNEENLCVIHPIAVFYGK